MKLAGRMFCLLLACCLLLSALPVAARAEGETACPTCGQTECICDPGEDGQDTPTTCTVCNADPCVCPDAQSEEDADLCTTCQQDPCACDKDENDPVPCEVCNATPCICCDKCGGTTQNHIGNCPALCDGTECADGVHVSPCKLAPAVCPDCGAESCICCAECNGTSENHDADCPTRCGKLAGCTDGAHDPECTLYVAPQLCEKCRQETCICCPQCGGTISAHATDCPTLCTGCADGVHVSGCPLYVAPALCEKCQQETCICCDQCDGTKVAHAADCLTLCLGAEVCVNGVHTTNCPLYVVPTCTKDENCTLTEGHLEGCPKVEAGIMMAGTGEDELTILWYQLGFEGGPGDAVDTQKPIDLEVGMGCALYIAIGEKHVSYDTLSLSSQGGLVMNAVYKEGNLDAIQLTGMSVGETALYYTDPNTNEPQELVYIIVYPISENSYLEPGTFQCFANGGFNNSINQSSGFVSTKTFGMLETNGFNAIDPDKLYTTSDLITLGRVDSQNCTVTLTDGANGYICYDDENGVTHKIQARCFNMSEDAALDDTADLILVDPEGVQHSAYEMKVSESVEVTFRKGSTGASIPYTGEVTSGDPSVVSVTYDATTGKYTLTALEGGEVTLSGGDISCTVKVSTIKVGPEKLFVMNGSDPYGNSMRTYLKMEPGVSLATKFYFGTSQSSCTEVTGLGYSGITLTGPDEKGYYTVTAGSAGTGLIWYEKDGIQYTMPVRITSEAQSDYGDGNTIQIGDITYATGTLSAETLKISGDFGEAYFADSVEAGFSEQIVLAAMSGGTVATNAYQYISDVSFEMLKCVQESNGNPCFNASLSSSVSRPYAPGAGVYTWGTTVSAEARKGFRATIAMSFTLALPNETPRRITLQCLSHYCAAEGNIVAYANDLDTAAELNVVLSSQSAFENWLRNPGENAVVEGNVDLYREKNAQVTLYLPAVTFNDVVMAQVIPELEWTNDGSIGGGQIELKGNPSGGTVMRGLIHRGGLMMVENIAFVADPSVTMTYGSETFTCGILSDYTLTDINVSYDSSYVEAYCDDTPNLSDSVSLLSNSQRYPDYMRIAYIDVNYLSGCTFTGFDYGVYSTDNGLVGGGSGNTFENCYIGIYMDSANRDTSVDRNVDFNSYTYKNNVYAVRVKSLPGECTPYEFRIHDSTFINNHREFWITPSGDYYFYRNYYGGYWWDHGHCGKWHCYKDRTPTFDDWDREYQNAQHEGHRPGRYHMASGDKARVITTAGRSTVSGSGAYWIYDREDQHNRILYGEGKSLKISEESIDALEQDTDVYIVDSNGNETAVITFQGKEG